MFKGFFKSLDSILYVQVQPDRLTMRHVRPGKESVEFSDEPCVAIAVHPKRGKEIIAVGHDVKTNLPSLQPDETLLLGNGFKHPRSVIGDFELASIAWKAFMRKVITPSKLFVSPTCLIQVLDNWEGGLTEMEQQGLRELALINGAKFAFLIEKPYHLTDEQLWELYDDGQS